MTSETNAVSPNGALGSLRQADHVEVAHLPAMRSAGSENVSTPEGAVIVTQTCDLIRRERPTAVVAPVVRLDGDIGRQATDGKVPRYVPVPALGGNAFAQMDRLATVDKDLILSCPRQPGVKDDDLRRFGRAIGRNFSRFAFPEAIVPYLRPLQELFRSKYGNEKSAEGRVLESVAEFRIQPDVKLRDTNPWQGSNYFIRLSVLVNPGILRSELAEDISGGPPEIRAWLLGRGESLLRKAPEIASRLTDSTQLLSDEDKYFCWMALAEAWVEKALNEARKNIAKMPASAPAANAIVEMSSEVLGIDDYSLAKFRLSESLDMDDLSDPAL